MQWVKSAEQGLAYLRGEDRFKDRIHFPFPYLVLIDLNLPGSSGFEVLKWIRQQPELSDLMVWVYSNSLEARDATIAYQLDANSYVVKPRDLKQWADFIRTLEISTQPYLRVTEHA